MISAFSIEAIAVNAIPLILAITIHEAAHGYVAKRLGDNTAFLLGRITLNPFKHIDLVGTLVIPLVLILLNSGFLIGYAKPVPVRFDRLKNPKIDMIWVALAGPGSNFIQAIAWAIFWFMPQLLGIDEPYLETVAKAGVMWNISLLVFNLLPIPPMDGGRVLTGLLPYRQAVPFSRIEPWGFFIVLGLALSGLVNNWWMQPLSGFFLSIIRFLMWPLQHLL